MNDQARPDFSHRLQRGQNREKVPRILLRAITGLVVLVLVLVAWARLAGVPPAAMPPDLPIVQERQIVLFGGTDGSASVLQPNGTVIARFDTDQGGFIAGVQRSLARQRMAIGADPTAPVRLVRFSDGHLGLRDDVTGWRVELIGFGRDNTAAFARLLPRS